MNIFSFWRKGNKLPSLEKRSEPISTERVGVRPHKQCIQEQILGGTGKGQNQASKNATHRSNEKLGRKDKDFHDKDSKRDVRLKTTAVSSPVNVRVHSSASDIKLESNRLVITKEERNDFNNHFENMAAKGNDPTVAQKRDDCTQQQQSKSCEMVKEVESISCWSRPEYNRCTESARLPPDAKPVELVRSSRLNP
ncbi:hypothetical protein ACA910_014061 [Epithemia clementina (nom. ined.)]